MRRVLKFFSIVTIGLSNGLVSSSFAAAVSCNMVPQEGTGILSAPVTQPAWRIRPELETPVGDFPWYPPAKSPQLYQFDCSDNPKGKPQSGVTPTIPLLEKRKK